ncbi:MAG: hypothetical protein Q8O84_05490 [Nanoarchaeota archaeon]|nr:hypothetical protein [Nanoarchaeota archaeon]
MTKSKIRKFFNHLLFWKMGFFFRKKETTMVEKTTKQEKSDESSAPDPARNKSKLLSQSRSTPDPARINKNKFVSQSRSASENQKKFQEMTKKQKKNFLSNDLSERIIRVEQRVSTKFGKLIPYNKTEYYKHMDKEEKKKYDEYLKNRGNKEIFVSAIFLGLILVLGFFNFSTIGNAVQEDFPDSALKINLLFVSVFIVLVFGLVVAFLMRLKRKRKYREHIRVIDKIIFPKH